MKLHIKYDTVTACKVILQEQLEKLGIAYELSSLGEVELKKAVTYTQHKDLNVALKKYGIEILDDQRSIFVQKIKDTIIELVNSEERLPSAKFSDFLAHKLNHSYGHISKIFSDVTYTSIENFIILQKIERAKQLVIAGELTLTEIAWQLNYSSVQHLSNQFKKTTGITPTAFQRIIKMRRKVG
jgi:AraC-like DNA-binding protein